MSDLENQNSIYGCTRSTLNHDAQNSPIFQSFGPVIYAVTLMDDAIKFFSQEKPEEAKQYINRAKWVLFTFVMGDDE